MDAILNTSTKENEAFIIARDRDEMSSTLPNLLIEGVGASSLMKSIKLVLALLLGTNVSKVINKFLLKAGIRERHCTAIVKSGVRESPDPRLINEEAYGETNSSLVVVKAVLDGLVGVEEHFKAAYLGLASVVVLLASIFRRLFNEISRQRCKYLHSLWLCRD